MHQTWQTQSVLTKTNCNLTDIIMMRNIIIMEFTYPSIPVKQGIDFLLMLLSLLLLSVPNYFQIAQKGISQIAEARAKRGYIRLLIIQGRSQPHIPGWASVPLSFLFLKFSSFFLFFLKLSPFLSLFGPPGGATRPPGKTLVIRNNTKGNLGLNLCKFK